MYLTRLPYNINALKTLLAPEILEAPDKENEIIEKRIKVLSQACAGPIIFAKASTPVTSVDANGIKVSWRGMTDVKLLFWKYFPNWQYLRDNHDSQTAGACYYFQWFPVTGYQGRENPFNGCKYWAERGWNLIPSTDGNGVVVCNIGQETERQLFDMKPFMKKIPDPKWVDINEATQKKWEQLRDLHAPIDTVKATSKLVENTAISVARAMHGFKDEKK